MCNLWTFILSILELNPQHPNV
ncbi:hypothetical protein Godav_025412 [Gossypium davidsonii]|uniref:Uncharacterized protein n=1 Tax=Gossypium davidsonii TaxID=34287 RepID=A0A7J8TB31_GOSDV|nr:hypothetical protein [Gossypium davidsonii]